MKRVLVLRAEPGASATLERARGLGLHAVAAPLFEVEPADWEMPDPNLFDGLLLTSANAVRHAGKQLNGLRGLRAYAVGPATASAARNADFEVAATGDSGVGALLASIPPGLKLLHLCGAEKRQTEGAHQEITPVIVYRSRQIERPDLSNAADCIALIHSPRAGARFAELVRERGSVEIAAISLAAAEASGTGWASTHVAKKPIDEALLALAASLCNKLEPK